MHFMINATTIHEKCKLIVAKLKKMYSTLIFYTMCTCLQKPHLILHSSVRVGMKAFLSTCLVGIQNKKKKEYCTVKENQNFITYYIFN